MLAHKITDLAVPASFAFKYVGKHFYLTLDKIKPIKKKKNSSATVLRNSQDIILLSRKEDSIAIFIILKPKNCQICLLSKSNLDHSIICIKVTSH